MLQKLCFILTLIISLTSSVTHADNYMIDYNMAYRQALISQPELKTYFKSTPDNYVYFGAKFEPRSGVYIGTPYDRPYTDIKNSINTEYEWFNTSEAYTNAYCARKEIAEVPSDHTVLTGFNWNFALREKIIDISDYSNYIYNKIDELAARGEDIILIFGKEFNIDSNFPDPQLFIEAFQFVAEYAKTKENIAMCWAPNDTGGLDTSFEQFYPGNEYVDWIGCSLYSLPNFQGNPDIDDGANMCFIMGKYANPAARANMIHSFLTRHAIQKPVIITEGGVGFEDPDHDIDYTAWASHQLRLYYSYICRRYPEFKCIVSFNHFVPGDLYRYDMDNSPILRSIMQEVTQDPIYLTEYPSSAPYAYSELYDNIQFTQSFDLSTYAYVPANQKLLILYYIDGALHAVRKTPPYDITLDSNSLTPGKHTITTSVFCEDGVTLTQDYTVFFSP